MKKSLTLIELLIASVLTGVVLLGIFGIYNASSGFFISSDTKSVVLNDMTYVLNHLDKNVYLAIGSVNNPAITVTPLLAGQRYQIDIEHDTNNDPSDLGEVTVRYLFNATGTNQTNSNSHTITFRDRGGTWHTLTSRLVGAGLNVSYDPDLALPNPNSSVGVLFIDGLTLCYDPDNYNPQNLDQRNNPTINITSQRFSTLMQSIN